MVLEVTHAQVYPLKESTNKTRAMARVVLNDQLQLTGLRVVDGSNGLFVSYPNDPGYKGEDYRSIYYPITRDLREHIEEVLLQKYHELTT
ncbi:MAG: stage V sporulation protein K [Fibrobacter sp.]|nr:stage V sporulation protein K [Fibrobacter sp.]